MARQRKNPGARKNVRVDLHKPGFLMPAPDAPWIECMILEVSDDGVCLDVCALRGRGLDQTETDRSQQGPQDLADRRVILDHQDPGLHAGPGR